MPTVPRLLVTAGRAYSYKYFYKYFELSRKDWNQIGRSQEAPRM